MPRLAFLAALSGLTLAACAPTDAGGGPTPSAEGADQCRASSYQSFVGRNRSTLPPKPDSETWRVTCTTCPVTMDFNPSRLNILFDERTGVIRQVTCG